MPHPERAFYAFLDSEWSRRARKRGTGEEKGKENAYGDGTKIFESVLNYLRSR
jgi:phosphoribosylformylglycinamidine (FGAM) synthase-like amidotransferase family enzyme